ncbi:hypothetical protein ACIRFH_24570 [Streptomyces sp. NPDC093586]|uniref:hypothetical protein n=1 Tax=Streptomyces sp. NPDC093586 TaxID=3366042 RepID=UPI00382623E9
MWDFAELSEEASKLGGPAALRAAYIDKGFQKAVQLAAQSLRQGRIQGFVGGVLAVGVSAAGWKAFKAYCDRTEAATSEAAAVTADTAPAAEEAVIAEAEAVIDEPEPDPATESSPSAAAQPGPAAGEQPRA